MKNKQLTVSVIAMILITVHFSFTGESPSLYTKDGTCQSFSPLANVRHVDPVFNEQTGFWEFELASGYQSGPAKIGILLPDNISQRKHEFPILYILPVGGPNGAFGDGLMEAKKANLANKYEIICVRPYFTSVPWYGDHAIDPHKQHESYLIRQVIPVIDSLYPTEANAGGRWLIGFSKSGWGACTLLMRHPDVFGYAAAWDAPFMLNGDNSGKDWGPMGLRVNFGTKEQMQQFLPTRLAETSPWLKEKTRLVIGPGQYWKEQTTAYHEFLKKLDIPHIYRSDLVFKHRWDSGWFGPMAEDLVSVAMQEAGDDF